MSGHSKWSSIKHKKAATDAKRGKIFTKLIKEITVAARMGGGDIDANPRLRAAVLAAKSENMPKDNIERAIKKGTGELEGVSYEESIYEGYGPGGTAILLDVLTDNKNRTVAEIRHILSKNNGNLGEAGCVAWIFDKKGLITVKAENISEDDLMELALEAGADDMRLEDDIYEIVTQPVAYEEVKKALAEQQIETESTELTMIPKNTVKVSEKEAEQLLKLMDLLEDHDDVNNVYSNFDIEPDILEKIGGAN